MAIVYVKIGIAIHGLEIEDASSIDFLVGWLREATKAALPGNQAKTFNYRDVYDDDIVIEIEEHAGKN